MNTEELKTFIFLSKVKNFTLAAEQMYIAQSTVTNRISELEKEVGKKLFSRGAKTVTLTGNKTFDPSKTWHFRTFFYTGDSSYSYANFKLAIDNISITVKEVVDDTVERTGTPKTLTFADIDGKSYTLTGADDNYTALSGAMQYLDKSKVVASERSRKAKRS